VVSKLGSRLKGCGFKSSFVSSKILDRNGVKAMPGSIPSLNTGSVDYKKNTDSQMVHTKKKLKKTSNSFIFKP
jgi:hypothetical protein